MPMHIDVTVSVPLQGFVFHNSVERQKTSVDGRVSVPFRGFVIHNGAYEGQNIWNTLFPSPGGVLSFITLQIIVLMKKL